MVQYNSSDNCVHHYNIEILNLFDPELQLINTEIMIKNKLNKLLNELKKFKVQVILVLKYKKRNDHKTFHSSAKLIASDLDIDETFKSMHQSIMTNHDNYACKDWIVSDVIIMLSIKFFECQSIRRINSKDWSKYHPSKYFQFPNFFALTNLSK